MIRNYRDLPVPLAAAAALAYRELVAPERRALPYDAEHFSEMLNLIAHAIARVAPLYAGEDDGGARRALGEDELEGMTIRRGATIVALADGRKLTRVTVRRGELRDAIAILKAAGLGALGAAAAKQAR